MTFIKSFIAIAAVSFLAACDRAPANVQTLFTTNCGESWNVIKIGERIPKAIGTCEYKTVIPDFPMQGDTEFKAQFEGNVLVTVKISYDYEIIDGVAFIKEAKFLGKSRASAEDAADGTKMSAYESAENQVIDKRIREATTSMTVKQDIVDVNVAKLEDDLLVTTNTSLKDRGVRINSMTFIMIPEEQTRMAIDAATAVNVYKNKGLQELGEKIAVARAGAAKIVIDQGTLNESR